MSDLILLEILILEQKYILVKAQLRWLLGNCCICRRDWDEGVTSPTAKSFSPMFTQSYYPKQMPHPQVLGEQQLSKIFGN